MVTIVLNNDLIYVLNILQKKCICSDLTISKPKENVNVKVLFNICIL